MAEKILVDYLNDKQIVRITLNAPKGNVLDAAMMSELLAAFDKLKNEPQVKWIQFIGGDKHFSFGASVEEHTKEKAPEMLKHFHQLFYSLADLSIPTAALVSGQCLGGGLELALCCSFIFVDSTAKLGQPEISLGVYAPPASCILPMKIGQARADELLLTGKIIGAEVAVELGLAAKIYEDKEAMINGVDEWVANHILPKSASSLRIAQKAARIMFNKALFSELKELERMYVDELMETHDANEGINSFLERRKPEWKNK